MFIHNIYYYICVYTPICMIYTSLFQFYVHHFFYVILSLSALFFCLNKLFSSLCYEGLCITNSHSLCMCKNVFFKVSFLKDSLPYQNFKLTDKLPQHLRIFLYFYSSEVCFQFKFHYRHTLLLDSFHIFSLFCMLCISLL